MTLKEWRTGNIPVVPFPATDVAEIKWRLDYSFPRLIGMKIALVTEGARQAHRDGGEHGDAGRRHAERTGAGSSTRGCRSAAARTCAGRSSRSASNQTVNNQPRLSSTWLLLPIGLIGGTILLLPLGLGVRGWRRQVRAQRAYSVELETVVGLLEPVLERPLERTVRQQQPFRAGLLERGDGLVRRQVPARPALRVRRPASVASQRKRSASRASSGQRVARPGVARVGEHGAVRRDAEPEREHLVVQDAARHDLEARGLERPRRRRTRAGRNALSNISGWPSREPSWRRSSRPVRRHPELRAARRRCPGPSVEPQTQGTRSPQWSRCQCVIAIASTSGQRVLLAQAREHARARSRAAACPAPSTR